MMNTYLIYDCKPKYLQMCIGEPAYDVCIRM